jgi:short-subunit dehydrogenase
MKSFLQSEELKECCLIHLSRGTTYLGERTLRKITLACAIVNVILLIGLSGNSCYAKNSLKGKVVVITGATSGFGKGSALKMAAEGAYVVLAARRAELLKDVATSCEQDAIAVPTDVSNPADIQHLADVAMRKYGHIDVWINDVGVGALGRFEDIPLEDHARLIDVNLKGVIYGSHVAMKIFDSQTYGTLINLGSIDSEIPMAYQASYAASKAAVLSLGHTLSQEVRLSKNKNIKISTIMPWAVDTPWWNHAANYSGGTPRMALMDDPQLVVKAIVKDALHPKKEVHVGWKAGLFYRSHRAFPGLTERLAANVSHKYQIETAPPAPNTPGTLHQPMVSGTDVVGGVRERMDEEKQSRKSTRAKIQSST